MIFVSILTRRLKEGKTYEDFRKAWYHTVGFGTPGKLYTAINAFDSREIIVIGIGEIKPDTDPMKLLRIDVKERIDHPLDAVVEPEIGRTFGVMVAEDDFSPAGKIEYKPAAVDGKQTDFNEIAQALAMVKKVISQAPAEQEKAKKEINQEPKQA